MLDVADAVMKHAGLRLGISSDILFLTMWQRRQNAIITLHYFLYMHALHQIKLTLHVRLILYLCLFS